MKLLVGVYIVFGLLCWSLTAARTMPLPFTRTLELTTPEMEGKNTGFCFYPLCTSDCIY